MLAEVAHGLPVRPNCHWAGAVLAAAGAGGRTDGAGRTATGAGIGADADLC